MKRRLCILTRMNAVMSCPALLLRAAPQLYMEDKVGSKACTCRVVAPRSQASSTTFLRRLHGRRRFPSRGSTGKCAVQCRSVKLSKFGSACMCNPHDQHCVLQSINRRSCLTPATYQRFWSILALVLPATKGTNPGTFN